MRGLLGMAIGIALGASAMYLALERPWQRAALVAPPADPDAGVAAPEPAPGKGKRRVRRRPAGSGAPSAEPGDAEPALVELSAADRRLVWRGEAVALPPARHDFSAPDEGRALSDDEIGQTVREQGRGVIDCMVKTATGTDLTAKVTLQLLVDGAGKVTRHRVQAPQYLFEQGLAACVASALRGWRFPSTGAPTLVTAPFQLE